MDSEMAKHLRSGNMSIETLEMHENSGADGVVRLSIPTGHPDCPYRIIVLLEPKKAFEPKDSKKSWPPGFLEQIVGGWTGNFVEEPEGNFEERESF